MSHAITSTNGFNEMAFVGETPWHGLGQKLALGASLETWEEQAGMKWRVQRSKVRYATQRPEGNEPVVTREWGDRHVLFRSDTQAPLGLVSERYQVVQPRQVLAFFDGVARENGFTLETAGTLNGGRQYWAMAKTPLDFAIAGVDVIRARVLLSTSADGSMATQAKWVEERVVCANTLAIAHGEAGKAVRVKHSTKFDETRILMDMQMMERAWAQHTEEACVLATKRLTRQGALQLLINTIGDNEAFMAACTEHKGDVAKALEAQPNVRQMGEIISLFEGRARGADCITSAGTAWGLVNAATEYYDHVAGRAVDTRLHSAWFGKNDERKTSIYDEALKVAMAG